MNLQNFKMICCFCVLAASLACEKLVVLVPVDGQDCFRAADGAFITGEEASKKTCHLGKVKNYRQIDGSYKQSCNGSAPIAAERCEDGQNGIGYDQDCSGDPDNIYYNAYDYRNTCSETELGVCKLSLMECVNDQWVCVPPPGLYGPQTCEKLDTDCNGLIGGEDPNTALSGPEWQYSGPPGTEAYPPCRPGHLECIDGQEYLRGQVLPTEEICSAPGQIPVDENCNGQIDEDSDPGDPEAILISFDTSGSMDEEIAAAVRSLCIAGTNGSFVNSKVSIQLVGLQIYRGGIVDQPYVVKLTDFVSFTEACNAMMTWLNEDGLSGGIELFPYAIWAANNLTPSGVNVSWPLGMSKRVVIFSDERPQPYQTFLDIEIDNLIDNCLSVGYTIGVFAAPELDYTWQYLVDSCSGWVEPLSNNSTEMSNRFEARLGAECTN